LRAILAFRGVEVLAATVGPVLGTHGMNPLDSGFKLDDIVCFAAILVLSAVLIATIWRETGRVSRADDAAAPAPAAP
jgi:hypothetical protein